VIGEILPPQVAVADTFDDLPGTVLFPAEEAAISKAVDKRRREFTTATACARQALAKIGVPAAPLVPGERGAPRWPAGVVGSMTHCAGYRAAAVALARDIVTIGLDAEPDDALPDGVLPAVSLAQEQTMLGQLMTGSPPVSFDRLLFSAKESVYKAWFPLTGRWLGFHEAAIVISPDDGTFTARLLVPGPVVNGAELTGFSGRWLARHGLVVTAIAVPATAAG
jgi:4'-phosphopantetheinyl transferase EntD